MERRKMFSRAAMVALFGALMAKAQTRIAPVQMSVQVPVMSKLTATRSTDGKVWTVTNSGVVSYAMVFWNGLLQETVLDYNRAGNVITFVGGTPERDAALALPTSIVQIHGYL